VVFSIFYAAILQSVTSSAKQLLDAAGQLNTQEEFMLSKLHHSLL